jgi:peptidyl-dipeptidase Dcp
MEAMLMNNKISSIVLLACLGLSVPPSAPSFALRASAWQAPSSDNPLLVESSLAWHYPRFDLIRTEHYAPAFLQGMKEHLREIDAIANNPEATTFDNTLVAMEKSGALLTRVNNIFSQNNSVNTNPDIQKIQRDFAPQLSEHNDAVFQNQKLFRRINELYRQRETLNLDPESKRLLWRYYQDFVRAGAKLSAANQVKLKKLNSEIAALEANFNQHTLSEVDASSVYFDSREALAGLTEAEIETAAEQAAAHGHAGKFEIRLQNTTDQAALSKLSNRSSRLAIMAASQARGNHGGSHDTRSTIVTLAKKRAEKAKILGYATYADYVLAEQTVGSVATVNQLLKQMGELSIARAQLEANDLQMLINQQQGNFKLAAADWQYYAEQIRKAKYDLDDEELRPYFELNHVLVDGVFFAANKFYGISFKERFDLPVYEPTVRVFDVYDHDGSQLAIVITDLYARSNKNGGAWMNEYAAQNGLRHTLPIIGVSLNIPKPSANEATLMTSDEVRTLFHEFGHALHGMFSHVKYPRFAGTNVPSDFVEYPSQINEMWSMWPEVLKNYARHYQTGEAMPATLLEKMEAARHFNQGYVVTERIAADVIDQAWHQTNVAGVPNVNDVMTFETHALQKAGLDFEPVPPRYRSTYFSHSFSNGYAAGYYSYLWSEVLDADSVEWIKAHGGLTRENGDAFRKLLSRGGSEDALTLFRNFTGGEPYIDAMLKRHGLA